MGKGYKAQIAFDLNNPMGDSSCVACGECMVSCPTGALANRKASVQPMPGRTTPAPEPVKVRRAGSSIPLFEEASPAVPAVQRRLGRAPPFQEGRRHLPGRRLRLDGVPHRKGQGQGLPAGAAQARQEPEGQGRQGQLGLLRPDPPLHHRPGAARRGPPRGGKQRRATSRSTPRCRSPYDKPVATLEAGDIFGEMTCMNNYPRSATVQAEEDCTVLEMLRNVLYILQRSKKSRQWLDERYRTPLHRPASAQRADLRQPVHGGRQAVRRVSSNFLRPRVELMRFTPGEVIFRQGDPADDFYLVRVGFVKVSQQRPGGEQVLSYIGPGGYFGEIGLLSHLPEMRGLAPPGVRTATCSALDHVDLVQITRRRLPSTSSTASRSCASSFVKMGVERLQRTTNGAQGDRERAAGRLPQAGADERPEPAGARPGEMHPLRRMHQGLCRLPRRRDPADPRGAALRQVPGGQLVPVVPGPVLHGRLPGRLDPPPAIRARSSSRTGASAAANVPRTAPTATSTCTASDGTARPTPPTRAARSPSCSKRRPCATCAASLDGQPSCVYACPHDAAHRMSGAEMLQLVKTK